MGGWGNAPLLFDSGRGGAPLAARRRLVLLLLAFVVLVPFETCIGAVTAGGYGRVSSGGGGRAAAAGDGAAAGGAAVPGSGGTGLALPPIPPPPNGPLLSGGKPVVGKSDFLGANGLACTDPVPDDPGSDEARVAVVVVAVIP